MGQLFEQRDELLSAYLDDELSADERVRLETQLATDQMLQTELDALRRAVTLVRDLPSVPLPRNFILPQTMAIHPQPVPSVRPRRSWLAPFLTTATAVVSLMFVVVLAGDLLLLSSAGQSASAPAPDWAMTEIVEYQAPRESPVAQAPVVAVEIVVEAEEDLILETMPAEVLPEAEVTTTTVMAENYTVEASNGTSSTVPIASGGEQTGEPAPSAPSASPATELVTVSPAPIPTIMEKADDVITISPTAAASARVVEGSPTLPPQADRDQELVQIESGEFGGEARDEYASPLSTPLPWRTLEIVLGMATLGLAIATVSAWRARRQ